MLLSLTHETQHSKREKSGGTAGQTGLIFNKINNLAIPNVQIAHLVIKYREIALVTGRDFPALSHGPPPPVEKHEVAARLAGYHS